MSAARVERAHGRAKYVAEKCRCRICRAANNAAQRRYQRRKAAEQWGMPPVLVDAEPVRRHVRALMAGGVGWQRIARLSGVPSGAVSRLLYGGCEGRGPSRRVRPETASKLLALGVDQAADGARIDATGTRRRLQALVALGWSGSQLMRRLGREPTNFGFLLQRDRVEAQTARAVRRLYDQLWDARPPQDTPWARAAVVRARRQATERGWVAPLAWDEDIIDDPTAQPAIGETEPVVDEIAVERAITNGNPHGLTKAERVHLAATLYQRGQSRTTIARVLRCSGATVNQLLNIPREPTSNNPPTEAQRRHRHHAATTGGAS